MFEPGSPLQASRSSTCAAYDASSGHQGQSCSNAHVSSTAAAPMPQQRFHTRDDGRTSHLATDSAVVPHKSRPALRGHTRPGLVSRYAVSNFSASTCKTGSLFRQGEQLTHSEPQSSTRREHHPRCLRNTEAEAYDVRLNPRRACRKTRERVETVVNQHYTQVTYRRVFQQRLLCQDRRSGLAFVSQTSGSEVGRAGRELEPASAPWPRRTARQKKSRGLIRV